MEPLPRFFRMTDRPAAPLFNRLSGRPFNRVIKFDCFLLAWSQIQIPGDLPAILVDSGWFEGVLPRCHRNIIILGDRNLVINRQLDRILAKVLDGNLILPLILFAVR